MEVVDTRGLSCPQPVLLVLEKIKTMDRGQIKVLVDTETARENVTRAATSKGWQVKEENEDSLVLEK
ncbi:MAG: tRNA 2-thiouridine synthesizing protein [Desulfonauticus sp.]|jgi:TusA-related sulfurtransferase|nr:MAG: SirA-like domain-containing protein [Desulfonauticus sp. 38_4375]MDK2922125.1 tRNA 2-thiouridine synthesizing protein [Desulfonauticus sp.]